MNDYTNEVIKFIAESTGLEVEEIKASSYIEDDLNIGEFELIEILEELEEKYEVDLVDYKDDLETISDIVDHITEKNE